jgi:hypothetical protein
LKVEAFDETFDNLGKQTRKQKNPNKTFDNPNKQIENLKSKSF